MDLYMLMSHQWQLHTLLFVAWFIVMRNIAHRARNMLASCDSLADTTQLLPPYAEPHVCCRWVWQWMWHRRKTWVG